MKVLYSFLKLLLFITTSLLTGIFLFIFILSLNLNNTIFTSDFHEKLLIKNDVYSHVYDAISTSMDDIINNLKGQSTQTTGQHEELYYILKKSTSAEMIKMNLDSITQQTFQYFKGQRKFLPDIYIDIATDSLDQEKSSQNNTGSFNNPSNVSGKIKKINLNAILLSVNRTDILDQLMLGKLIYFIMSSFTWFSLLSAALMLICVLLIYRKLEVVIKWLTSALLLCGTLNLALSIALFLYIYRVLPENSYLFATLLPLKPELIMSYINDTLFPLSFFCLILGILFAVLSIGIHSFKPMLVKIAKASKTLASKLPAKSKRILKYGVMTCVFVFIISGMGYNLYAFKRGFDSNNFSSTISRLTDTSTVTQVISAKNDTIYTLQIKLVDAQQNQPIPGIQINVSGKSRTPEKYYSVAGITDEEGSVKFTLGQGTFHLILSPLNSPGEYNLPSPFFFELKSVGTTILTVNLDKNNNNQTTTGIAEIEILDYDNLPVENIELYLEEQISIEEEKPVKYYSVTNTDGIAAFKLSKGTYSVGFSSSTFPKSCIMPEIFQINISSDYVTRYTIKLSKRDKGLNEQQTDYNQ